MGKVFAALRQNPKSLVRWILYVSNITQKVVGTISKKYPIAFFTPLPFLYWHCAFGSSTIYHASAPVPQQRTPPSMPEQKEEKISIYNWAIWVTRGVADNMLSC